MQTTIGSIDVPLLATAPFVLLLLGLAILPLAAGRWWDSNGNKALVSLALGVPAAAWAAMHLPDGLQLAAMDFLSFMVLLGSLYVVTGGIFLDGDLRATPAVNCAFLATGAVLANLVGTTGASMLLIRPLLATNAERTRVTHTVVFFIFIVCNAGGLLTPLGDPPLFVGYLNGVPFGWTLGLWPFWLGVVAALLLVYYAWDAACWRREPRAALLRDAASVRPLRLVGKRNLPLLAGIVAAVSLAPAGWREASMIGLAMLSLRLTPEEAHRRNLFSWGPITEVGVLFSGIFVTMVPALAYLEHHGASLGLDSPAAFFWASGTLSSFLDNTPTYLTFASVAVAKVAAAHPEAAISTADLGGLLAYPEGAAMLRAVSLGSVLMGAMTYIGNGPNFMVRAIAESRSVRMPGFFGYMLYSLCLLLPVLIVLSLLAFHPFPVSGSAPVVAGG